MSSVLLHIYNTIRSDPHIWASTTFEGKLSVMFFHLWAINSVYRAVFMYDGFEKGNLLEGLSYVGNGDKGGVLFL